MTTEQLEETEGKANTAATKPKHRRNVTALLFLLFLLVGYLCVGIFVIQPIGAVPDGATVIYWRLSTNMSFISSADGMLLKNDQGVSLLGRGILLGKVAKLMEERKIVSLPYSRALYLFSTGGREFEH